MIKKLIIIFMLTFPMILLAFPEQEWYSSEVMEVVRADSAHGFDVEKYEIFLEADTGSHYIEGMVNAQVTATDDITQIIYNLEELGIDEVLVNNEAASYTHTGGIVTIELGNIVNGEEFTTSVSYHGYPANSPGYGCGMIWSSNYLFTVSDPDASRYWWPCYDHPWDKAVVDMHITLRDDWLVAANGIRSGIEDNGNGTNTTHWLGENPMTTYLVCFHAADFVEFEQDCTLPNGENLPIQHFCVSSQLNNAQTDFENMPWMIEYFSETYGLYPFEKFGNCVVPMSIFAGMEHQTMVTLANYLVTGNQNYETVFAHELAHHWYGDCVAFLDFPHVWLSEGFAVYSEALWTQERFGWSAMQDYVESDIQNYYLSWAGGSNYTIYNPSFYNYFTPPVYEKAASVLHMLRLTAGNEAFFEILQTYFATYQNSNAVTSEFVEIVETVTGEDYGQFFEQWIYGSGLPSYEYMWFFNPYTDIPRLRTYVKTTSSSSTEYYGKVPFEVAYEDGNADSILVDSAPWPEMTESLLNGALITEVQCDPHSWLLDRGVSERRLEITGVYPFEGGAALYWENPWEDELEIDGYRLLRAETPEGIYLPVTTELIANTMYIDEGLEVGEIYYYKVMAVIDEYFESQTSEALEVEIESWPMDQGILIVDETGDGSGLPGNPSDEQVDEFYAAVCGTQAYTSYDYATQGAISVDTIKNYSTVIWHDADLAQKNIAQNEAVLGSYIYAGGNLLISGWKTCDYMSEEFLAQFTGNSGYSMVNEQEFTGAESSSYTDLVIDEAKLPSIFNGHLPYVGIFPEAEEVVYTYLGIDGSSYTGQPCGVRMSYEGECIILGFPLYLCYETGVSEFVNTILEEFEGSAGESDEIAAAGAFSAYPNPFYQHRRSSIQLSYDLGTNSSGRVSLYNLKGQRLAGTLLEAGSRQMDWNLKDNLSSGVYFILWEAGSSKQIQKLVILK